MTDEKDKNITVLVNPFDIDLTLIDHGIELAKKKNLPVHLHSVIFTASPLPAEPIAGHATNLALAEARQSEAEITMKRLIKELRQRWSMLSYRVEIGFPADKVVHAVNNQIINPYLLVVGRQEGPGFFNELFGTSSTVIAENAECPVLVVPGDKPFAGFLSARYVLERGQLEMKNIKFLASLMKPWNGYIAIFYLSDQPTRKDELAVVRTLIQDELNFEVDVFNLAEVHDRRDAQELNQVYGTSLFAFPHREKSFFQRLYDNDNTRKLILESTTPILVF